MPAPPWPPTPLEGRAVSSGRQVGPAERGRNARPAVNWPPWTHTWSAARFVTIARLPVGDRDWVVVGANPQELLAAGYLPVGATFRCSSIPKRARSMRWRAPSERPAPGYHGFAFHAEPGVTLEEDLARRDLTINAIAQDENGGLIDPYGGRRDLRSRCCAMSRRHSPRTRCASFAWRASRRASPTSASPPRPKR